MTIARTWLRRTTAIAATSCLLTVGGAVSASSAFGIPAPPATDCFGHSLDLWYFLHVPPGGDPFFGTAGDDLIIGSTGQDRIYGLAGDDTICAGDAEDLVYGDEGADDIDGERGTDEIHGGDGDDYLLGGLNTAGYPYHEAIYGDDGNDYLRGESGPDTLLCGNPFIAGDSGDVADGGTGMPGSLPEDDIVWTPADCPIMINVP